MELQDQVLSFPLTNLLSRQVFRYSFGNSFILMMYDSGAQIPVWCRSVGKLLKIYPDAKKTEYHCEIAGFGKETEMSDVYVIPTFELSDGSVSFRIENLVVAVLYKPFIGCDFLLSETMFSKTDTLTTRREKRELKICFDDIGRPFRCTARMRTKDIVQGMAVWTQEQ